MNKCRLCGANHVLPIQISDEDGSYYGEYFQYICDACWDIIAEVAHRRLKQEVDKLTVNIASIAQLIQVQQNSMEMLTKLIESERSKRVEMYEYLDNRITNHINNCHGG